MDAKEIRELIQFVSESDFETFELEDNGFKIKLVRREGGPAAAPAAPLAVQAAAPAPASEEPAAVAATAGEELHEVNSPIVGTFYAAPGPDSPNFVEVGTRVKKGQVLCIVEAMKVMNEIESEVDGEVVDIVVKNGQPIEFGEILFRLRT